ncbi:MAG: glycoside hydrolase family 97 catalytic domain-containing protein, partial [Rikenellaceae bacterium]
MKQITTLLLSLLLCYSCSSESKISSPNKSLSVEITTVDGELNYSLWRKGELLIDSSNISIFEGKSVEILSKKTSRHDQTWSPVWGQFSQIRDRHTLLEVELSIEGRAATLYTKLFDDGVGFRFRLDDYDSAEQARFYLDYNLQSSDKLYYTAGERSPIGPIALDELGEWLEESKTKMNLPLYIERGESYVMALLESDLFSAVGCNLMKCNFNTQSGLLEATNSIDLDKESLEDGTLITPWRVILVGETAGDLVTNCVTQNLAAPCQNEDFEWVKPGKTLWDWRVHGYVAPDGFEYGIDTESYLRFIDFAAEQDIDYFLIDDDWYHSVSLGHFDITDEFDLEKVIEYAGEKGVKLLLYYDRKKGYFGDDELFPYYRSLDMHGIKYGFMGNSAAFTRDAIAKSAKSNLIVNFHDGPVPMSGVERTSPNAIAREYCHAQQDSRRAFTPETFIKMALINSLQGTLDMNNGNFDIVGINSGSRAKSPRPANSYPTTVTSELARTLIINTGLLCIPDAPEAYEAKMDLFNFIKIMPVGEWDESRV